MSIARFFDKTVIIHRLKTTTGNKKTYQSTATVDGAIQSLDREARQKQGITEEKAWVGYFEEDADVKEGDHLTDSYTNRVYQVREVVLKDYGINQHKQLLLMEQN